MTCELCGVPLDPYEDDYERTLCTSCSRATRELEELPTDPCAAPEPDEWEKLGDEP
jgi:hypothetical protein